MVYDEKDSVQDIDLYRFTTNTHSMLNATENPDNTAFCVGGCGPSGIIPIGQCQEGGRSTLNYFFILPSLSKP